MTLPPSSERDWPTADAAAALPTASELDVDPHRAVADLIVGEAAMLDAGELDRWLALFTHDARYWVPLVWGASSPDDNLNLIYDDRRLLEDRVFRIQTGDAHSQDPPSRTVRVLSAVRCRPWGDPAAQTWWAHTTFSLSEVRRDTLRPYAGRLTHLVRAEEGQVRIARKRVDLATSDHVLPSLTFLL